MPEPEKNAAVYPESGLVKSAFVTSAADISVFILGWLDWQVFHSFPPNYLPKCPSTQFHSFIYQAPYTREFAIAANHGSGKRKGPLIFIRR